MRVDTVSQTVTVEAGIFGPELEARLAERGLTLGHFPQSFEYSTLGGWIATRSSGQNSLSYGGIDKLVESLRIVTPEGTVETLHVPRRADGPDVSQMLIGSESAYGALSLRQSACDQSPSLAITGCMPSRILHGTRGESLFGAIRANAGPLANCRRGRNDGFARPWASTFAGRPRTDSSIRTVVACPQGISASSTCDAPRRPGRDGRPDS